MNTRWVTCWTVATLAMAATLRPAAAAADKLYSGKPIRALLITGGCCHNYKFQAEAMQMGIGKVADVEWTVVNEGGNGTRGQIELYNNPDWAMPYDVVVHNECFADTTDLNYVRQITTAHKAGKPALVIHCAMHTYRAMQDNDWREFLGVTSRRHEALAQYTVKPAAKDHAIMRDFPDSWQTPRDELYVIEKLWPGVTTLATSHNQNTQKDEPVAWVHDYHGARVFGTTFGHSDDTFRDPVFLNLLGRGLLWASGRMTSNADRVTRFDQDQARVIVVNSAPGARSSLHHHKLNRVMIYLDAGTMTLNTPDGKVETLTFKAGEVLWSPATGPHTSENTSGHPVRIVEVELKSTPGNPSAGQQPALDPVVVDAQRYHVELENNQVRVMRVVYEPHGKGVMHEHSLNRVATFLSGGSMKITTPDNESKVLTVAAGDLSWGGKARHQEENLGDKPFEVLVVELKK